MDHIVFQQKIAEPLTFISEPPEKAAAGDLKKDTHLDPRQQACRITEEFGVSLRVCENRRDFLELYFPEQLFDVVGNHGRVEFEQSVAARVVDGQEFARLQFPGQFGIDPQFGARVHLERDFFPFKQRREFTHGVHNLPPGIAFVLGGRPVGSTDNLLDPIRHGNPCHGQTLFVVSGPVIETREDMAVKVKHAYVGIQILAKEGLRHAVTLSVPLPDAPITPPKQNLIGGWRASRQPPRISWWSYGESNPGPLECHSSALPTELQPRRQL